MPYFIYRVFPFRRLEKVDEAAAFGQASTLAKALRADPALPANCTVKVIFAASEPEAEELRSQVRERAPGLADDE